jgi:hypothetical protein
VEVLHKTQDLEDKEEQEQEQRLRTRTIMKSDMQDEHEGQI